MHYAHSRSFKARSSICQEMPPTNTFHCDAESSRLSAALSPSVAMASAMVRFALCSDLLAGNWGCSWRPSKPWVAR